MFQNILYPFDGTARCMLAIPQILEMVRRMAAQLRVLHVNRGSPYGGLAFADLRTEIMRGLGNHTGLPAPIFAVVEGKADSRADEEILRYASEHHVDLIAMPARGLTRLQRLFRRSTTEWVLRHAPCPVWIIAESKQDFAGMQRIVCAVDNSGNSRAIVRSAADLARQLNAHLTLAYAVPELNEGTLARMSQDPPFLSTGAARRYLHNVAQTAGVYADYESESGGEDNVFTRVVRRTQADLLLLDRSMLDVMPGVSSLLRRAGCAVLVTNVAAEGNRRSERIAETEMSLVMSSPPTAGRHISAR